MSRKTFFSFHFKRDVWRAGQVRNSNVVAGEDEYGFVDAVEWEKIEREGDTAIERWIVDQLKNTSVTVVLIGAKTSERDWIDCEIRKSWERGNGLVGVRIHNMKDQDGKTDIAGDNPLDQVAISDGTKLSGIFKTYDWVTNDGRANLGKWIEEAFTLRDKYDGDEDLKKAESASVSSVAKAAVAPTIIQNPSRPWSR